MALEKIRKANKKWKHEQIRRKHKQKVLERDRRIKKEMAIQRKAIIENRRQQLEHRTEELNYVERLKAEVVADEKA